VSSHPRPLPSCTQGPPRRSVPQAASRFEAKVADTKFIVHCERICGVGLLWRSPGLAKPSTTFTSPTRCSPTSPALASTPPPTLHRWATSPKKRHCGLPTRVSPLLSTAPKSVHCLTGVHLGLLPHLLMLLIHWIDGGAATEPPWVERCSPFPCLSSIGPPAHQQAGRF
jgi:hypothetical protein